MVAMVVYVVVVRRVHCCQIQGHERTRGMMGGEEKEEGGGGGVRMQRRSPLQPKSRPWHQCLCLYHSLGICGAVKVESVERVSEERGIWTEC
jgi:hypothetical protein